ncbi:MAG: hypothetical protein SGJ20_04065 [Planctomycetota bacterium]|nr:hypothetical protein [Planctomycetota bacterium]
MQPGTFWRRLLLIVLCCALADRLYAGDEFELPPIRYSQAEPNNAVYRLKQQLERGEKSLAYQEKQGYLPALLAALKISDKSQTLVYSKTSLQTQRISPETPRAIYFNDNTYIGYCKSGDVIEISTSDNRLGTVFYTLDQRNTEGAKLTRQTESCLVCHSSSRTGGVPGHVVRSLFVNPRGQPLYSAGSYSVDHTTPIEQRWGGWYVTGQHGKQTHLGNLLIKEREVPEPLDNLAGHNVLSVKDRFFTEAYPTEHSDIVALMIMEHQALVHNCITKASFETRQSLHYEVELNRALGDPENKRQESTTRRIHAAGDALLEAILMVDEAKLTDPLKGTSGFSEEFVKAGPHDKQGRSLRDLDMTTRMFKYPCSYLIYSEPFRALPVEMQEYLWQKLHSVLTYQSTDTKYEHLSAEDRQAILEILRDTRESLPSGWKEQLAKGLTP